jgi:hypothetical protein
MNKNWQDNLFLSLRYCLKRVKIMNYQITITKNEARIETIQSLPPVQL